MGNTESNIQQQWIFLESKFDQNYGDVTIYLNRTTMQQYADMKKILPDDADVAKVNANYIRRQQLTHENLIEIVKIDKNDFTDLCASYQMISLKVQYYLETLSDDIKSRKQHRTAYTEMELLYILYSYTDFILYMSENKIEILDLHPSRILLDESRKIKIFDSALCRDGFSNYHQVLFGQRDIEYLSPEQLLLLIQKVRQDVTNQEKSNVFCLGLLMVSLMSGHRCTEFYDSEKVIYNDQLVLSMLAKSCSRYNYSQYLEELIQWMLSLKQEDRPTYVQVVQTLLEQKHNFAACLNPPGMQPMQYESATLSTSFRYNSEQQSGKKSDILDFNEIDRIIKLSRGNAQLAIDQAGLPFRVSDYPQKNFEFIE